MDLIEQAAEQPSQAVATAQPAQENKPDTDLNPVSQAPNLWFPIPKFQSLKVPRIWISGSFNWIMFIVNRVTTEKDKCAVVVANLLFKVVRRITRTLATEDKLYTVLKELVVKETDLS